MRSLTPDTPEANALEDYQALSAVALEAVAVSSSLARLLHQVKALEDQIGQTHRAILEGYVCDALYNVAALQEDARASAEHVLDRYCAADALADDPEPEPPGQPAERAVGVTQAFLDAQIGRRQEL